MKKLLGLAVLAATACGGATEQGDGSDPVVIVTTENANNGAPSNNGLAPSNNGVEPSNNGVTNNNGVQPGGLALLGNGQHTLDSVQFSVIASQADNLRTPRDLAFHPSRPSELWILNLDDNSTVVIDDPGTANQRVQRYASAGKDHFMARPSAIAFGENGNFASAQETDDVTQPSTPADFMGPTLWTSDRTIYDGGHGGHLDMLHNSPNGAGIAWETGNKYWIFDGYHQSITAYDFNMDHGPGGQDHTDGNVARYVEGEVGYVENVPSHLEFHHGLNLLFIADTGNNRVATLDPTSGEMGQRTFPNYDGGAQYYMNGGVIETLADGAAVGLEKPSGLAIHGEHVYVGDNALSKIVALDLDGNLVDYLDLSSEIPAGGLMGLEFAPDGSLFAVDAASNAIVRIAASEGSGTP